MSELGLFINYEWCTGCRSCEMACKQEQDLDAGEWGIRVLEFSYQQNGKKVIENHPILTEHCNFCEERVEEGKKPACVHHCQANCMTFDTIENLRPLLEKNNKGVIRTLPRTNDDSS